MADVASIKLPNGSEYSFKDIYARQAHNPEALDSRTFTDVIATANDNVNGAFFYLRFRGTTYNDYWHIKVRVKAWCPSNVNYETTSIFDLFGYANTYSWFACVNRLKSTSYRPIYYNSHFRASATGYNNGCYNYIGFNLANSTNPTNTSLKRSVTVDLLQYEGCEAELLDELVTPTDIPDRASHTSWYTSAYNSFDNFDAYSYGLKQTGDANTTTISTLANGSGSFIADSAVYRYQMLFEKDPNTLTPLNNVNNDQGTSKTMLTDVEFDAFGRIYYYSTTTAVSASGNIGAGSLLWHHAGVNMKYSFNCGETFTAHRAIYLVVTPTSNGKCKIASTLPLTQDLPTTADGKWYILLGRAYSTYQITLFPYHRVFMHNGISVQEVLPQNALVSSTAAGLMSSTDKTKLDGLEGLPAVSASDNGKVLKVANGEWGAAASEVEIEDSLTSQSATKALSAKQGNVLAGKIMSKAWTPESGDTLLTYIINNVNKGDLPFSGIKVGSVTVSDTPYTTQEFTIFITGHTDRMDVCVREYGNNGGIEYHRAIWQNAWNGWWRRVDDLRADASSLAKMNSGDNANDAINSGEYVYIRNHGTLPEGLYKASTNIASSTALSSSNLVAQSDGLGGSVKSLETKTNKIYNSGTGTTSTSTGKFSFTMPNGSVAIMIIGGNAPVTIGVTGGGTLYYSTMPSGYTASLSSNTVTITKGASISTAIGVAYFILKY